MKIQELLEATGVPAVPEYAKQNYQQNLRGLDAVKKAGLNLVPFDTNPVYRNPVYIYDNSGRYTVLINMGNYTIPFYWSTGLGGKERVPSDKWYPFFGIGPDKWINKGSQDMILDFYGSSTLKNIANILNSNLRPSRDPVNVAGYSAYKKDIEQQFMKVVNNGLRPASSSDTNTWLTNMNSLLQKVGGKQYNLSGASTTPAQPYTKQSRDASDRAYFNSPEYLKSIGLM